MKKLFTILVALLLTAIVFAQVPQKMSYQAIIRNASGNLVTSSQIGMEVNIRQGSETGAIVYTETQTPTTNDNGLVSIEIGGGAGFSTIDWGSDIYYIETKTAIVEPLTTYTITGVSQLLSVPYALNARTAESVTGTITETDPVYTGSQAANITVDDITKLSNLSGKNTGDQDLSGLATTKSVINSLATKVDKEAGKGLSPNGRGIGDMQYWNGTAWVAVPAGTTGQLLSMNASGIPQWLNPSSLKSAATQAPTMTAKGVIFNGVVNPNDYITTVAFEYGTTTAYGNTVVAKQSPVTGTTNTVVTSDLITTLIVGTTYHVRMITQNIFGTFYGNDITFTYLYYGASYAGGYVFSIDNSGQHGLVCATTDQSVSSNWENAFKVCARYFGGGFDDWYLPSLSTLYLMYVNLQFEERSSFEYVNYWSSNETTFEEYPSAWILYMGNGFVFSYGKDITAYVRAVRAF